MSAINRITLVLRPQDGTTLEDLQQYVKLGMPVGVGRALGVITGASDEDLQLVLGRERDERQLQSELWERALKAPPHLAIHTQEMFDLLRLIDTKCGGLDAALSHGIEPSDQMWNEDREAKEAIWDLLDKIEASAASVDTAHVNQIAQDEENVNQSPKIIRAADESRHIDARIKEAAAEPVFLSVVFKLPNAQAAGPLINQLPYGQFALGTQAKVFGMTTGNLMEAEPCAS